MSNELKRRRGAPAGNQNARKHGFYSRVITKAERRDLRYAAGIKNIDQEIDLLRVRLKSILEHDSGNTKLILQAAMTLARLLRTRHYLGNGDENNMREIITRVLEELLLPLGIGSAPIISTTHEKSLSKPDVAER